MDPKVLATVMGVVRSGVGGALVVAPGWAGRIWIGPDADGPATKVLARALGARDVVLGAGMLAAAAAGDSERSGRLLQLGVAADAADVAATIIAARHLEGRRGVVMPVIAGAVGIAGVAVWKLGAAAAAAGAAHEQGPAAEEGLAAEEGIVDQQDAVLHQIVDEDTGIAPGPERDDTTLASVSTLAD